MALRPEDVIHWVINDELVLPALIRMKALSNGRFLVGIYARLRAMLSTYPPDPKFFSHPRQDLHTAVFWVKSENSQVRFRAKYFAFHGICIIDKLVLPGERTEGLDP